MGAKALLRFPFSGDEHRGRPIGPADDPDHGGVLRRRPKLTGALSGFIMFGALAGGLLFPLLHPQLRLRLRQAGVKVQPAALRQGRHHFAPEAGRPERRLSCNFIRMAGLQIQRMAAAGGRVGKGQARGRAAVQRQVPAFVHGQVLALRPQPHGHASGHRGKAAVTPGGAAHHAKMPRQQQLAGVQLSPGGRIRCVRGAAEVPPLAAQAGPATVNGQRRNVHTAQRPAAKQGSQLPGGQGILVQIPHLMIKRLGLGLVRQNQQVKHDPPGLVPQRGHHQPRPAVVHRPVDGLRAAGRGLDLLRLRRRGGFLFRAAPGQCPQSSNAGQRHTASKQCSFHALPPSPHRGRRPGAFRGCCIVLFTASFLQQERRYGPIIPQAPLPPQAGNSGVVSFFISAAGRAGRYAP